MYYIWIPVYYRESDHTYHRVLPDFLVPYKHYCVNAIESAVSDDPELDVHDLPCDSSRAFWKKWVTAIENAVLKLTDVSSVSDQFRFIHHSDTSEDASLSRRRSQHWLALLVSSFFSLKTTSDSRWCFPPL